MDQADFDRSIERLLEAFERFGPLTDGFSDVVNNAKKSGSFNADALLKRLNKPTKDLSHDMKELLTAIEKTQDAFEKEGDVIEQGRLAGIKEKLIKAKELQEQIEEAEKSRKQVANATGKVSKAFDNVGSAAGKLIHSLLDNSSITGASKGLIDAGLDMAGGMAKGVTSIGNAMAGSFNPIVAGAGIAVSALGLAAETTTKVLKFANDVLSKEVEKTVKAFNQMSSSGAIFSDGMTGMRNAAVGTGLTLDQFSNVVKKNSQALAESGMGVAAGAKQVGDVGKIIKNSGVQSQLLKLGYSFEEQAELTAQTIANMRRSGGGKINDQEVAKQTESYANNLRLLASITGEDAKAKAEKVKSENTELAFKIKESQMTATQRAQLSAAMAGMTEIEKKNLKDRMVYGTVVNSAGAVYEATIDGARELGEKQKSLLDQGVLNVETGMRAQKEYSDRIGKSALNSFGLATAAYGNASDAVNGASKGMVEAIDRRNMLENQNIDDIKSNLEKTKLSVKDGGDKLTDGVTNAAIAAQELAVGIQELMLGPMTRYAEFTEKMLNGLRDQLIEMGVMKGKTSSQIVREKEMDEIGQTLALPQNYMSGSEPQYALGGIASGPESGFKALLHGIEAVVPLPDGKSIPVEVSHSGPDMSSLVSEIKRMSEILLMQNKLVEEANDSQKLLLDLTESHKRTSDRILDATA